jgi:hypothetical protein
MTQNSSFHDVEKLSAYLDGQLKPSETARLESRLQSNPELASILNDLRQARGILRQLPQRRAPRNFTLTPKMVGQKPPMPRTYPVFRFATALATLLLFFTFATNFMAPRLERTAVPYGIGGYGGGGGGGDAESELAMEEAPTADDSARLEPTTQPNGMEKSAPGETYAQQITPEVIGDDFDEHKPPISPNIIIVLAGIALLSGVIALLLRYAAIRKWRAKAK